MHETPDHVADWPRLIREIVARGETPCFSCPVCPGRSWVYEGKTSVVIAKCRTCRNCGGPTTLSGDPEAPEI